MNTNPKPHGWTRFAVLVALSALLAGIVMVMGQEQHHGPAKVPSAPAGVSATQSNNWMGSNTFPYLSVTAGGSVPAISYLSLDATGVKMMPSGNYLIQNSSEFLQGYQTLYNDMWGNTLVQSGSGGSTVFFGNGSYAAIFAAGSNTFMGDVIAFAPAHFIGDASMISYPQTATPPTAASIGGAVGSATNHMLVNVGGALTDYYSDGATVWSLQLVPPPALGK